MPVIDLPYPFDPDRHERPFESSKVNQYRRAGWKSLIPLPYGKQDPPPSGFSGRVGIIAGNEQIIKWIHEGRDSRSGTANIAIVHTRETIAIDVDHYPYQDKKTGKVKQKLGGDSLKALEEELGVLPPTWRSSARGQDNPSGQRFFRLRPEHQELDFSDKPGPSIEIVRFGHRYSVVWPSMNGRLGEPYEWYEPSINGGDVLAVREELDVSKSALRQSVPAVPEVKDLPYLPDRWVDYLTNGFTPYQDVPRKDFQDEEVSEWVVARPDSTGEPCIFMQKALESASVQMADGAHDTAREKLMYMMNLGHEGHTGLLTATKALREVFMEEVSGRRSPGAARAEWYRSYVGAVNRVAAREDAPAGACPCWLGPAAGSGGNGPGKDPATYRKNDDGNAEHLVDLVAGDLLWCEGYKGWLLWGSDEGVWTLDERNAAVAKARLVQHRLHEAAEHIMDIADDMLARDEEDGKAKRLKKRGGELMEWARQCGNRSAISNMLDLAKSYSGVTVPMDDFDADPAILVFKGGTIELLGRGSDEGIRVRESRREDLSMHSTGIEYMPWSEIKSGGSGAGLELGRKAWEDYLQTFIPDVELQLFVQRLLGYSLLGANPERKAVFFQGPTSTGKSTILEAASAALGRYASSFNLSMFRENQDEAPRPDVLQAMTRRLIVATEGDAEWFLHADSIKRMVGGVDKIRARALHSNKYLERAPAFVPFVGTNSSPTITGADAALWQRVVAVPFDIQRLGKAQKKGAASFLQQDMRAKMSVFSWLVDGYIEYARLGIDDEPSVVVNRGFVFRAGVSDWHSFMSETLEEHPGERLPVQDIYNLYCMWASSLGIMEKQQMSKKKFEDKLGPNNYPVKGRVKRKGSQSKCDHIMGWRVKPLPADRDEEVSVHLEYWHAANPPEGEGGGPVGGPGGKGAGASGVALAGNANGNPQDAMRNWVGHMKDQNREGS